MKRTKNIFEFATKELSQDAFLRWLFENWNSAFEDVNIASRELLRHFLGFPLEVDMNITYVETLAQKGKIDVLIFCTVNNNNYVIAIEDKTITTTHDNQLDRYAYYMNKNWDNKGKHIYILYKTNLLTEREKQEAIDAKWSTFDIKSIHRIFSNLKIDIKNHFLKDYVDYIESLYDDLATELPREIKDWNMKNWYNFALTHKLKLPNNFYTEFGNYQNKYIYIAFLVETDFKLFPYLEIRSRDFNAGSFIFRILIPDKKEKYTEVNVKKWKESINKSEMFKVQNNAKQIGINKINDSVKTIEELEILVLEYIGEYRKLMF